METTHIEMSGHNRDGVAFVSAKIHPHSTAKFIDYLCSRLAKPFSITINAGLREDGSQYDLIELDSASTGLRNIDRIIAGFPVS